MKIRRTVTITDHRLEKVEKIAEYHCCSVSRIIDEAIRCYLLIEKKEGRLDEIINCKYNI